MRRIAKSVAVAAVLALVGCAYPDPGHVAAMNALVGKSEIDVVHALGVPSRSYSTGGHRFLAYSRSRIETLPGGPGWGGGWGGGWGYGYWGGGWGGFPPEIVQRDCETTFDLENGKVQSWSFRGNSC